MAETSLGGNASIPLNLMEEQTTKLAPNPALVVTINRLFEEQPNEMANHMMRHFSYSIKPMAVNAFNDVISRLGTSNQSIPIQPNTAASGFVPLTLSQMNGGKNLGQVIPPPMKILQRSEDNHQINLVNGNDQVSPIHINLVDNNMANQNIPQMRPAK